jgi:hypothetical protein
MHGCQLSSQFYQLSTVFHTKESQKSLCMSTKLSWPIQFWKLIRTLVVGRTTSFSIGSFEDRI